ncbi:hypothetical protein SAMN04488053_104216 [Alkalicoccus daliensis]|uniref:Uncharacterized protein n=1 Tax=Alkalicoccus daliensis TaxID=745820 RepID=A0A1H0F739_9BACI|nr:hypothetical protein SAMN04488053_104216 [Alkalicoccus daliensis]
MTARIEEGLEALNKYRAYIKVTEDGESKHYVFFGEQLGNYRVREYLA